MKTIKFLILAVVLMVQTTSFANNSKPLKSPDAVLEHVSSLLKNPKFNIEGEILATVKLIVNNKREVVVLNITSTDDNAMRFIKSRLNYAEVNGAVPGEQFTIPVRLVESK